MMVYRMALFFMCVGVMSGIMGYIMEDAGGDNWYDQSVPNMTISVTTSGDVEYLQFDGGSGLASEAGTLMKTANLAWDVLEGVFNITGMLHDVLVYDNGNGNGNLFEPVLDLFQGIIYLIYIVGGLQFISNRSMKVME
ncbi:MAG: hypothetical protein KAJ39_09375 [Gammaproteobacteria bacterium]|nr:hypothetical protein [Gammaproteobacteria bacterium]